MIPLAPPAAAAVLALAAGPPPIPRTAASSEAPDPSVPDPQDVPPVDAIVVVEKFGEFRVRLHPEEAPNHVAGFLTLAASGYYDGMSFHRVIPRFLVQAGDPSSRDEDPSNDGAGGPPWRLPPEPTERTHRRGTFSLAWRGDRPGTASNQWFVALSDLPQLDGHATPIGEVVEGMEVVDRIAQVTTHRNRNPLHRVVLRQIRLVEARGAPHGATARARAEEAGPPPGP